MWTQNARFCPLCGVELVSARVEGRQRRRCPACAFVLYENPASAAAGVVLDASRRVLLIRRGIEPFRGAWALPAGYQEADEEPEQTVVREVREETGQTVAVVRLLDLIFIPEDARKPANLAVFLCRPLHGVLRAGQDALEAAWFELDALPAELGFDNGPRILERLLPGGDLERPSRGRPAAGAPSDPPAGNDITPDIEQSEQEVAHVTEGQRGESRLTYKDAGVDIGAQDEALARARDAIRASFTPGVLGDVGAFGGLFDPARVGAAGQVLVASADGVGTKLEVAKRAGVYDTVGRDLVQHCINDILVQGARPLFFMDYVGTGRLEPAVVADLIRGCAQGCRDNGLALLGGETAEMPGLYAEGDFDLVGFIVGAVARERLLDGSRVRAGQVLLGLGSDGLHTNGYSLARMILFERLGLDVGDRPHELGGVTVGEALLAPHRAYLRPLWPLLEQGRVAAMAHITGGGLRDNLPRVLGANHAVIERSAWEPPALFRFLCAAGGIELDEAHRAFNMGVGLVLAVDAGDAQAVSAKLRAAGERVFTIGHVAAGAGAVRWVDA